MNEIKSPVTAEELYVLYAELGITNLIAGGYFNRLGSTRLTATSVVGSKVDILGSTFLRGTLDYTAAGLTEVPLLQGFLSNLPADHAGSVTLFNATKTSVGFIASQYSINGGDTLPLNAVLTLVAL